MLPGERDEIRRRAAEAGLSVADFVRRCCLGEGAIVATPPARRDLLKVEAAVNKIGGNVNQIARMANLTGDVTPDELDRLFGLLEEVHRIIDAELSG